MWESWERKPSMKHVVEGENLVGCFCSILVGGDLFDAVTMLARSLALRCRLGFVSDVCGCEEVTKTFLHIFQLSTAATGTQYHLPTVVQPPVILVGATICKIKSHNLHNPHID